MYINNLYNNVRTTWQIYLSLIYFKMRFKTKMNAILLGLTIGKWWVLHRGNTCLLLFRNTWSHLFHEGSTLPKEIYTTIYASTGLILNAGAMRTRLSCPVLVLSCLCVSLSLHIVCVVIPSFQVVCWSFLWVVDINCMQ